jgi:hypothetical protein
MITLEANEKLTLQTSSTSSITYRFTYGTVQPIEINGTVSAIESRVLTFTKSNRNIQEVVSFITLCNDGLTDNTVTLYKKLSTGVNTILYKVTLSTGDIAIYNIGDWKVYNSIVELKTTGSGGGSPPVPSTPSFEWLTITSNTLAVENKGYITNSLGRVEITLNSTNSGALTGVTGKDTGGWQIIVPAGKILRFDEIVIDNYLESNLSTDSVMIVYLGEDIYQVISSIGNLTYNLLSLPIP